MKNRASSLKGNSILQIPTMWRREKRSPYPNPIIKFPTKDIFRAPPVASQSLYIWQL